MADWLPSLVLFLPALGALAILAMPSVDTVRWTALGFTVVTFVLSLGLWTAFDPAVSTALAPQLATRIPWFDAIDISYYIGIDGLNLLLVLLTTLLGPIIVLSSWTYIGKAHKGYYALMLLLETGVLGVFLAFDVFLFYVFFELTLIPMVFIIGIWGGEDRVYAAIKFVLYTLVGSLLMLVGVIWLGFEAGAAVNGGVFTTDWYKLVSFGLPLGPQYALFVLFGLAFAIKVPLFPLHTWLPDAHTQAPTGGSVVLAGVLLKMGTYGLLRFVIPFFPNASENLALPVGILAVIGIVYGALVAFAQTDVKKLVAYSSVSHLGFVVLGVFAFQTIAVQGRADPDGEPRALDGRPVPRHRDALRAAPHARHVRLRRDRQVRPGPDVLHAVQRVRVGGAPRSERVRRRVHDPHRLVAVPDRRPPRPHRRRHDGRHLRRRLPPVDGLPDVLRRAHERGERDDEGLERP